MKPILKSKWLGCLRKPTKFFDYLLKRNAKFITNDKLYLSLRWLCCKMSILRLDNPQTFCEKLQWIKLYDRNPIYTTYVDKVEVKKYVASIVGKDFVIPTIAVWDNVEDISFDNLPNSFVIKCNHNSGTGMCICRDKNKLNIEKVKRELSRGLAEDYYIINREWPYKNVPRKIFAEQFISSLNGEPLIDYKFFCFNGHPKYCQVIKDRETQETIDFFDTDWRHQDFIGLNRKAVFSERPIEKPQNYELMIEIAMKLSKGIPFSRIDLYNINGKIYFGEITLFPMSGLGNFRPKEIDKKMGDMIKIDVYSKMKNGL